MNYAFNEDKQRVEVIPKAECVAYIVEEWHSGASWYRIYSDNWCEQGGRVNSAGASGTLNYHLPFVDTNYSFVAIEGEKSTMEGAGTDTAGYGENMGVTNFTVSSCRYSIVSGRAFSWIAMGYITRSEQ